MDLFGTRIKAFKAQELGTGTLTGKLGKCIVPSLVTTEPVTLVAKASVMKGETVVTKKDSDEVLFKATVHMGFMGVTVVVADPSGAYLCAAKGKKGGMMSGSFRIMRPVEAYKGQPSEDMSGSTVYPFGVGDMSMGMGTCKGSYSIIKGDEEGQPVTVPLYTYEKIGAAMFHMGVANVEGTLISKVAQPALMDPKTNEYEIAAKADPVAIVMLTLLVSAAAGGGAAGGLAGAGVV